MEQIKKEKMLALLIEMDKDTRDGELSMSTKHIKDQPRDSTDTSVSRETDHSLLCLNCQ